MSDCKYLSDGRKVALVGKLNNEEWIVQEVFVTEAGDEIPSGERFTAKSLHDAPVESWKDRDMKKKEARLKDLERQYDQIQDSMRRAKIDAQVASDIRKSVTAMANNVNAESLKALEQFLCGEIRWLVREADYSFYLPEPFDSAIQDTDSWGGRRRYEGLKLMSLFGKANGDLGFGINRYRDGSGDYSMVRPFDSFESASRHCISVAVQRAKEGKLNWSDAEALLNSDCAQYLTNSAREVLMGVIWEKLRATEEYKEVAIARATEVQGKAIADIKASIAKLGGAA